MTTTIAERNKTLADMYARFQGAQSAEITGRCLPFEGDAEYSQAGTIDGEPVTVYYYVDSEDLTDDNGDLLMEEDIDLAANVEAIFNDDNEIIAGKMVAHVQY